MTTTPKNPVEVLTAAKALLADPAKWTQGALARNAQGEEGSPGLSLHTDDGDLIDQKLVCFCAFGAMLHCGERLVKMLANNVMQPNASDYFCKALDIKAIGPWNDDPQRSHAEVMAAFDKAIDYATQNPR